MRESSDKASSEIWIGGDWCASEATDFFQSENPSKGEVLATKFPVSPWNEIQQALNHAAAASEVLAKANENQIADFLDLYAAGIEANSEALAEIAHSETGLPILPRLLKVELPRTTNQLRQAATAARNSSWRRAVRDTAGSLNSTFAPLGGPVVVMGPNNFPFAFNSIAGGDFAAALVAQNPVIAKANPGHPGTTALLARVSSEALAKTSLPSATLQLLFHMSDEDGLKLVSHARTAATAFTGSRHGGLKLKAAADQAGKLFYAELSSVNPVVVLGGALRERSAAIAEEFFVSCTAGTGQFCTSPGLLILPDTPEGKSFLETAILRFQQAPAGTLLSRNVLLSIAAGIERLQASGAVVRCGGKSGSGPGITFQGTLLSVSGATFLQFSSQLQTEVFGPVSLVVLSSSNAQTRAIIEALEGNLTGTVYLSTQGEDKPAYHEVEPTLRRKVGRLINNRMPTGVAVSPAMNHGGPFPATTHPGFTAVGLPYSIQRFAALHCYDNVCQDFLPEHLRGEQI